MKHQPFNHAEAKWDKYKAFWRPLLSNYGHHYSDPDPILVQFDTGEMMVTKRFIHISKRKVYSDLNMALLSPRDKDFPKVTKPDGTVVPKSHLTCGGAYHFMIDYDSGHVVQLGEKLQRGTLLPERIKQHAHVYMASAGAVPVGAPVVLSEPYTATRDERKHAEKLRDQCRAWASLSEDVDMDQRMVRIKHPDGTTTTTRYWYALGQLPFSTLAQYKSFLDMDNLDRCRLAFNGAYKSRINTTVPYLLIASS